MVTFPPTLPVRGLTLNITELLHLCSRNELRFALGYKRHPAFNWVLPVICGTDGVFKIIPAIPQFFEPIFSALADDTHIIILSDKN